MPTEFEVTENVGDFWVALLDIRNLLRCLASVFLRDGGSQIYHGYAWFRAVPALDESRPDLAEGGLVRAEVGPFRPHFYNAWMAQKNAKNAARDVAAVRDRHPEISQNINDINIRNSFRCV